MHELSIMESALDLALAHAREAGAHRIHTIQLRIGTLSGVVPEALDFAFDALRNGTLASDAKLLVEYAPATFWCTACADVFESTNMLAECPACGSISRELRSGREMELSSMEIE